MKFCKKRTHNFISPNNINTTFNYVTDEDVKEIHGQLFYSKWLEYINLRRNALVDSKYYFYYADYQHFARMVDFYLNPTS